MVADGCGETGEALNVEGVVRPNNRQCAVPQHSLWKFRIQNWGVLGATGAGLVQDRLTACLWAYAAQRGACFDRGGVVCSDAVR